MPTQRFNAGPAGITELESFPTNAGNRSSTGEKGTSVLLPLPPPNYEAQVLIAGGDLGPAQQTAELIALSVAAPAWTNLSNLNRARPQQVNTVLLPDGRIFLAGGIDDVDGGPAEIFDPRNPDAGWELCATMTIPRGYHSAAILLTDGSVLMGGDKPGQSKRVRRPSTSGTTPRTSRSRGRRSPVHQRRLRMAPSSSFRLRSLRASPRWSWYGLAQ